MNDLERKEFAAHLNRARDKALRAHVVTPDSVATAVCEAAATYHTKIISRQEMIPREATISPESRIVESIIKRLGWDLARDAINAGLVPVSLPVVEQEWVAWTLSSGTGPLSARYVPVADPARADFLKLTATVRVRPPWSAASVDCPCGAGDLGHHADCPNFDPTND